MSDEPVRGAPSFDAFSFRSQSRVELPTLRRLSLSFSLSISLSSFDSSFYRSVTLHARIFSQRVFPFSLTRAKKNVLPRSSIYLQVNSGKYDFLDRVYPIGEHLSSVNYRVPNVASDNPSTYGCNCNFRRRCREEAWRKLIIKRGTCTASIRY